MTDRTGITHKGMHDPHAEDDRLRERLQEAEETIRAIRLGEVDALVVAGPNGDNVYTLSGADRPYRVLMEAMSEGALTLSVAGVILYSNSLFAELLGVPLEHVIGVSLSHFAAPADRARVDSLVAQSAHESMRAKVDLAHATGGTVPVQLSTRLADLDNMKAVCAVVTDLTQINAAEEALRRAHDELELRVEERTAELRHANETRLRFLAMISHELRTPLQSIKGFATTLLAEDVSWDAESQRDFIQTIDAESDKLTDMIDQILDLSSIETGILRISPHPAAFGDILDVVMPELQTSAANHQLLVDIPASLPLLKADGQRVAQVLSNLVDNAVKYSPHGTTIRVLARLDGAFLEVDVADEGMGIPAEDRPHVFEAFWRSKGTQVRRSKGAGLGLAICKGLIEAHGGRIWLREHPGPGTTICFTLPIAQP